MCHGLLAFLATYGVLFTCLGSDATDIRPCPQLQTPVLTAVSCGDFSREFRRCLVEKRVFLLKVEKESMLRCYTLQRPATDISSDERILVQKNDLRDMLLRVFPRNDGQHDVVGDGLRIGWVL